MMTNTWTYRDDVHAADSNLAGYDVEATDGSIGKVDDDTTGRDHLIVDTGFWIFGKRRLLPAGVVKQVNHDDQKVYVAMTKDEIKEAPDLDEEADRTATDWSRDSYDEYYGRFGW